MATLQDTTVSGTLTTTGAFDNSNRGLRSFIWKYNSGASSMQVVKTNRGFYRYSFEHVGGHDYPTCSYSYYYVCPIQRNSAGWGNATIDVVSDHHGQGGYLDHYRILYGGGSDSDFAIVEPKIVNQGKMSLVIMNANGTLTEVGPFTKNSHVSRYHGINENFYTMPLFLKFYVACGATLTWTIHVNAYDSDDANKFMPPFKGPLELAVNTNPTFSQYCPTGGQSVFGYPSEFGSGVQSGD
jgi:hypothetical protein